MIRAPWPGRLERLLWALAAAGALWVLIDVATTIALRATYPYDLEWMEGGTLHHASRIATGQGIYVAPSVSFIPYLYTPLYPALIGLLGSVAGISYGLARGVSIAALLTTFIGVWLHFRRFRLWRDGIPLLASQAGSPATQTLKATSWRPELWVAALVAAAGYAAGYRYVDGWFDLARADSLFLCLVTVSCFVYVREPEESALPMRLVAITALLALAFFCKQTGVIYVGVLGALMLVTSPRRMWIMIPIAAGLGLGFSWVLQGASSGWFWTYVFELHQQHEFSWARVWQSLPNQARAVWPISLALAGGVAWALLHVAVRAPRAVAWWLGLAVAANIGMGLIDARGLLLSGLLTLLAGNLVMTRHAELGVRLFWRWVTIYGASLVVGAIGWGTQYAHFNAYMPALLHGAIACGALVIAALQSAHSWRARLLLVGATTLLCGALATGHRPTADLAPTAHDRAAGDALIQTIASLPGEVWVPSHPWYGKLAGKQPWAHRMGIIDVTSHRAGTPPRRVAALAEALRARGFGALVLDDRDLHLDGATSELLRAHYKPVRLLARTQAVPRLRSGAKVVPASIWLPIEPSPPPPPGTIALGDFEAPAWGDWVAEGAAFGLRPVDRPVSGQSMVVGYEGRRFATSMHQGDQSTGKLWRRGVVLEGTKLSFLLGGGGDSTRLRVELRINDRVVLVASPHTSSEAMQRVVWDVSPYRGQVATLVAIDDDPGGWGHLNLDDVRLQP